jgi:hypothetical protein
MLYQKFLTIMRFYHLKEAREILLRENNGNPCLLVLPSGMSTGCDISLYHQSDDIASIISF